MTEISLSITSRGHATNFPSMSSEWDQSLTEVCGLAEVLHNTMAARSLIIAAKRK